MIPAEAQFTRPFVAEIAILQRERSPDIPQSLWLIGCLNVLACTLTMIAESYKAVADWTTASPRAVTKPTSRRHKPYEAVGHGIPHTLAVMQLRTDEAESAFVVVLGNSVEGSSDRPFIVTGLRMDG